MDTPRKLSDEWRTPQWLFDELDREFAFNIDLCATPQNRKCNYFHYKDLLIVEKLPKVFPTDHCDFDTPRCFMNPPYSDPKPFVQKAWELSKDGIIVCLLKCDPSTRWWSIFWDHDKHAAKEGCSVRFLSKRVKFDPPTKEVLDWFLEHGSEKDKKLADRLLNGKVTTPAFPSAIVVMDRWKIKNDPS